MKTLRAMHANRGIEAAYAKRLRALIAEMLNSVEYWIAAEYKANPPAMAQDALPSREMQDQIKTLSKRWNKRFNKMAENIAKMYMGRVFKASDDAFMSAMRDAGMAVKFTMTRPMQDALASSIAGNVSLIKSIPSKYFDDIEGIVMRSYSAGRDLHTLSTELRRRTGATVKRAGFIARDQCNKAGAVVQQARAKELGFTHAVWMHSHAGATPRPDHQAANGKEFEISKGCLISGEYILPSEKINCRCTYRFILPN